MFVLMALFAIVTLESLVIGFFKLLVIAGIFGLCWWLVGYVGVPDPFNRFIRGALAVAAVFILIAILMAFIGHPIVQL